MLIDLHTHMRGTAVSIAIVLSTLVGYAQSLGWSVTSIDTSIQDCNDSLYVPITLYNTGASALDVWLSDGYLLHDRLYACDVSYDSIYKVDPNNMAVIQAVYSGIGAAWSIEIEPDASRIWLGDDYDEYSNIYNTPGLTYEDQESTGDGTDGIAFTPDGNYAVTASRWDDVVSLVDANTFSVIQQIDFDFAMDVAITSDGKYAIAVAASNDYGNIKIRLSDFTVVSEINTNYAGDAQVVITPDDRYAIVSRPWDSDIAVIDIETFTEVAVFNVFNNPLGLDVTPDGRYVYCVDRNTDYIHKIDLSNLSISSLFFTQAYYGRNLQIDQFGRFLYFSTTSGWIYKMDLSSEALIDSLDLFGQIRGLELLRSNAPWMATSDGYLQIPAGDSVTFNLLLFSSKVNSGTYSGYLYSSSNDISNMYDSIEVTFDINAPAVLSTAAACVGFDTVFQFGTNHRYLNITNTGCDTLNVTSLTTNLSEYTATVDTNLLAPGDTATVTVTFTTTGTGSYPGNLTIQTNANDTVVCLTAISVPGPEIGFIPASITATSNDCDDTLNYVVTVFNDGAQPLEGNISYSDYSEPTLQDALDSLINNHMAVVNAVPSPYYFSDGFTSYYISDGGGDMYDGGNQMQTDIGGYIGYTNNTLLSNSYFGSGGEYFTFKGNGLFVMAADMNNVESFLIDGNTGADGSGYVDTATLTLHFAGKTYLGLVKRIYGAGDPSINHLIIVEKEPGITHDYSTDTDDDDHSVDGLENTERIYYLLYASSSGGYINNTITLDIMHAFLETISEGSAFIQIDSFLVDLAPGDSMDLNVQLTTNGLLQGQYLEYLIFNTNDPVNPLDSLPVSLTFNGVAVLDRSPICLDFDSIFQYGSAFDTVEITNAGCDTLLFDSITVDNSNFHLQYDTVDVLPGDTLFVLVEFNPQTTGSLTGDITIHSNVGDSMVCLTGVGLPPPSMSFSPVSIDTITYDCDDTLAVPLTIYNSGAADLTFYTQESIQTGEMSLDSVMQRLQTNSGMISNVIPNRFDFSDGVTGQYIFDGGSDMFDYGNYLRTSYGSYIQYSNNSINSSNLLGTNGEYFTHKGTGLFVFAGDLDNLYGFYTDGGTGHDNTVDAVVDTLDMVFDFAGVTYRAFVKRVYGETEPSVNRIFLMEYDAGPYDSYDTYSSEDEFYLYNLYNVDRLYMLMFGSTNGGLITRAQMRSIMESFLSVIHGGETWLRHVPNADTIPAGDSLETIVYLSSTGINNGTYNGYLVISSNDPLNLLDTIPITFTVDGLAEMIFDTNTCYVTDTIFQYSTFEDSILITNTGCDTLYISSISSNQSYLSIVADSNAIEPGDSVAFHYTFSPTSVGSSIDSITFATSIGDTTICIETHALAPPTIEVSPISIDTTLLGCDDTIFIPVTIKNTGLAPLTYTTSEYWENVNMSLDSVMARLIDGSSSISSQIPNLHAFYDSPGTYYISDGGSDMYDGGNYLRTNYGGYIYYSHNTLANTFYLGTSAQNNYFTHLGSGFFALIGDLDGVSYFAYDGNLGHDNNSEGTVDTLDLIMQFAGKTYLGLVRRVYGETEPSVNHLFIVEYDSNIYDYSNPNVYYDDHIIYNLLNTDRMYALVFSRQSGGLVNRASCRQIMQQFLEVIHGSVHWVDLEQKEDTIAVGDSVVTTLMITSTGLIDGTHQAYLLFNSNDPVTPVDSIPITLDVQGVPDIDFAHTGCRQLDTIFQYGSLLDSFVIANIGCDTLVLNGLSMSDPAFSASLDTNMVQPGDSLTVYYNYNPTVAGAFTDTIYVENNAGDTFVCIEHVALSPPAINVSPSVIDTTIIGCDDTILIPVTIRNDGAADLIYNTRESATNPDFSLETVLEKVMDNSSWVSDVIPNRHDFTDGESGIYIIDGGLDMYDYGNYLRTSLGSYINYSNNTIAPSTLLGSNGRYFTHKGQGLFVFAGDLDNMYGFYFDGSTGTDGGGGVDTFNLNSVEYNGITYRGFVKRVYGETEPSVNHLVIIEDNPNPYQGYNSNSGFDDHYIYNLYTVDRLYALVFGEVNGGATSRNEFITIMEAFLEVIHGGESYMSFSNINDTIAPGDSLVEQILLTSTGQTEGTYQGYFRFYSNDPVTPIDSIEVNLVIDGTPSFGASDTCLYFDSLMQYTSLVDSLQIFNPGCDTLFIDSVYSQLGITGTSLNDTVLAPYDTLTVYFQFSPQDSGWLYDTVVFETNIGDQVICANAYAIPPPIISAEPDTLDLNLFGCCDTLYYPITVYNTGYTDLNVYVQNNYNGYSNSLQQVLNRFLSNSASITAEITTPYNFTDAPGTYYISDGGNDMYDGGNELNTNFDTDIAYSNNSVIPSNAFGTNGAYFTSKVTNMWMMAANLDGVTNFWITGNLGADGSGSSNITTISITHYGVEYTGFVKRVYGAGDPSVNHLIIVPNATGVGQLYDSYTNNDYHELTGLSGTSRIYHLLFARQSGGFVDNTMMENVMQAFLDACIAPGVVSFVTPDSATVVPGDSAVFTAAIQPCNLDTGHLIDSIVLSSNDPLLPSLPIVFDVQRDSLPPAPLRNDTGICFGDPSPTLTAVGENIRWYSDSALTTLVDTGTTLDSSMTAVGTYTFYLTQTIDSCEGLVNEFTFSVNTPPINVNATDTFACESGTIPDLIANGNNVYWFSDPGLTTLEYVGDTFSTGENTFGFYTYYLFDSVSGCPASNVDTVELFIDSIPAAPPVTDTQICITDSVPALYAIGDSVHWYSDPALTTLLNIGNSYTPTIVVAGNYNYYVIQVDTLTDCFSNYEVSTLTVQASPIAPVANNDTACFGSSIPNLTASGTNLSWYSDAALTTLVGTGSSYNTGMTAVGNYTYYVTQSSGTCEGPADSATLVITAPPSTPVALDTSICQGATTPALYASGSGLRWYSDTALTTIVHNGDTFTPSVSAAGTYAYYVTEVSGGCEGPADTSTLIIFDPPTAPTGIDTFSCFGQPVPELQANGTWNQWYSDAALTTLVDTGALFASGETAVGTYDFYVTDLDSNSGCESGADTVTLIINNAPVQPSVSDTSVCDNETIPSLSGSGINLQWYSDSLLTTLVATGSTFNTGQTIAGVYTYYVTDSLPGCPEGPKDTAVLEIRLSPSAPIVEDTSVCFGDSVPPLINQSLNLDSRWYSDAGLTTLVSTLDTFNTGQTAVGTYTYYVVRDSGACFSSTASATLDIIGIPAAPTMSDTSFCEGSIEAPLVAGGTSVLWYSDSALTTPVGSGDTLFTGQASAGSYTYFATQGLNGCAGPADSAILTILPLPAMVSADDSAICDGESIPTLTSTGSGVEWYSDSMLTALETTGNSFTPSVSGVGVFDFYVVQVVSGCASTPDTSTLTVHAIPVAPIGIDTAVCVSDPIPDLMAIGTGITWYSDTGLSTQVDTGVSYATGQTSPGVYDYYITQIIDGCQGPADTVSLTINTAPGVPTVNDSSICYGDTIPEFTSTGTNITWFDPSDSILALGNTFTPLDSTAGTYLYIVRDSLSGCPYSDPDTAVFIIHPEPSAPVAGDTVICFGQSVPDLTAIGQNLEWFADSGLTTLLDTGSVYATGETAVGAYTYYVRQTINACEGPATEVTLTIAPVPSVPTANDTSTCEGQDAVLYASGNFLQWYADSGLTTLLGNGDTLTLSGLSAGTTSVYVTDSLAGCPASSADSAGIDVIGLPAAPSATDTAICTGDTAAPLLATGTMIRWYSDTALTTIVDTGSTFFPTDSTAGVYAYYVTQEFGGCEGGYDSALYTVHAIPAAPSASSVSVCEGDSVPDLMAAGANISWYADSALTTFLDTGNSYTTGETAVGTYTFYITQDSGGVGCESPASAVGLTIKPTPATPFVGDTSLCFGDSTPVFVATGDTIVWSYCLSSCAATQVFGDSFDTGDTIPGVYSYYVRRIADGCSSTTHEFFKTVHALPSGPSANDTSICLGDSVPDLMASGSNIRWYSDSALLTLVDTGASTTPTTAGVGVYTYYATQSTNDCEGPATSVTLEINAIPSAPTATDTTMCEGVGTPVLFSSGVNSQWYSDTGLTTLIVAGDSLLPLDTLPGIYHYYVTQSAGVCESAADTATLEILTTPLPPTGSDTAICFGDSVPALVATGTTVYWYTDSVGGLILSIGDTFNTGQTSADTHTYYAAEVGVGCESPRLAVSLIIHPIPTEPSVSDSAICFGETLPFLYASGMNVTWFDDPALSSQVGTGDSLLMTQTAVGSYIYYATQLVNGCESAADSGTFTVNAIPAAPIAEDTTFCIGTTVPTLNAAGTNIRWYSDAALTTLLTTGSAYTPSISASGTYNYYVTQEVAGCEGLADTSTVDALDEPSIPTVLDSAICFGETNPTFSSGESTTYWYDDPSAATPIDSGATFTPSTTTVGVHTFYVRNIQNGCEGDTSSFEFTINALPASPSLADSNACEGVEGILTGTGQDLMWYSDLGLTTLVNLGDTFFTGMDTLGAYTFYVTQTVNGCTSEPDSVELTINPAPAAPVALDTALCETLGSPMLTATGSSVIWYANASLDSVLTSGNNYQPDSLGPGVYEFFVTQSAFGCESQPDTSTLSILETPDPPNVNDIVSCEGETTPLPFASGQSIRWYADAGLTNLLDSGVVLDTTIVAAGNYMFYATQSAGGCESPAAMLTVEVVPIPAAPSINDTMICFGAETPAFIVGSNEGEWFDNPSLLFPIAAGDTFVPNEEEVGIYTYYVTTADSGCRSEADTFTLLIMPSPLVTLNTYSEMIQLGDSVALQAFNAVMYTWSPPQGLTATTGSSVVASPNATTTYTVTGTNEEGCSRDTSVLITVMPLGIDLATEAWMVQVYPNPSRGVITLEINAKEVDDYDIRIFSKLGETVYSNVAVRESFGRNKRWESAIDLSHLAAGVYIVSVGSKEHRKILRIVLQ